MAGSDEGRKPNVFKHLGAKVLGERHQVSGCCCLINQNSNSISSPNGLPTKFPDGPILFRYDFELDQHQQYKQSIDIDKGAKPPRDFDAI